VGYEVGPEILGEVITADQNNYAPGGPGGGFDLAGIALIRSDAARNVTGFAHPIVNDAGATKAVINVGNFAVTLKFNNAGSAVGNRLFLPGAADIVLAPTEGALIFYDFFTFFVGGPVAGGWRGFKL
jgi:hypothetical protein